MLGLLVLVAIVSNISDPFDDDLQRKILEIARTNREGRVDLTRLGDRVCLVPRSAVMFITPRLEEEFPGPINASWIRDLNEWAGWLMVRVREGQTAVSLMGNILDWDEPAEDENVWILCPSVIYIRPKREKFTIFQIQS